MRKKEICDAIVDMFNTKKTEWRTLTKAVMEEERSGFLKEQLNKVAFYTIENYYAFLENLSTRAGEEIAKEDLEIISTDDAEAIINADNRFKDRDEWSTKLVSQGVWDEDPDREDAKGRPENKKTEGVKKSDLKNLLVNIGEALFKNEGNAEDNKKINIPVENPKNKDAKQKAAEEAAEKAKKRPVGEVAEPPKKKLDAVDLKLKAGEEAAAKAKKRPAGEVAEPSKKKLDDVALKLKAGEEAAAKAQKLIITRIENNKKPKTSIKRNNAFSSPKPATKRRKTTPQKQPPFPHGLDDGRLPTPGTQPVNTKNTGKPAKKHPKVPTPGEKENEKIVFPTGLGGGGLG